MKIVFSYFYGPFGRYKIEKIRDRFGDVWYFVQDNEVLDELTDLPAIIRQSKTLQQALDGLKPGGKYSVGIA